MKLTKMILAITLVLAFSAIAAWAQTASADENPGPNAAQSPAKSYRLTYTLTETDSGKRVGTQHFAMIIVTGRKTVLKQGSRVPIASGAFIPNTSQMQTQFQYLDVGLNIDASLDESAHGLQLNTRVTQSSIAEEKSSLGVQDPIVRQSDLEGTSILTQGKPMVLGSMDIPGSTRHLDVEVVMESVVQ